jgi:cytochrome b561/polyisoprenoid-binding protein YceI
MNESVGSEAQRRYTAVAIALHWLIASGIVGMIALGWIMGDLDNNHPMRTPLYEWHKSIGLTILMLTAARIVWRLMNPPPPEPPMPGWQRRLALFVHVGFYVLMIAMPLTGWLYSSLARANGTEFWGLAWPDVPGTAQLPSEARRGLRPQVENVHSTLAWVAIGLLVLHVGGALKHHFLDRDGLLARMIPGLAGRTDGPPAKARGAAPAFGLATLIAAAGVGTAALASGQPSRTEATAEVQAQAEASGDAQPTQGALAAPVEPSPVEVAAASETADAGQGPDAPEAPAPQSGPPPAWTVDAGRSSIVFRSAYMGRPFEGRFNGWTADIRFDPDRPEVSTVRVVIPTAQAKTGEAYFDENLPEGDWFDSRTHADAVFEVAPGGVLRNSNGTYDATGVLTLKGQRFPLRLPFQLRIDGATAQMNAQLTVKRTELGVGRDTLTAERGDEEWVADDVALVITVVATRR